MSQAVENNVNNVIIIDISNWCSRVYTFKAPVIAMNRLDKKLRTIEPRVTRSKLFRKLAIMLSEAFDKLSENEQVEQITLVVKTNSREIIVSGDLK